MKRFILLPLLVLFFAFATNASATLYISPNGSDSNDCSQGSPCQSFQRGYTLAPPGETVCLAPGTYVGQQVIYVQGKTTPNVIISGCGNNPTVQSLVVGNCNGGNQPRAVTFKDMAITGSAGTKAVFICYGNSDPASRATDITFDNVQVAVGQATQGPVFEVIGGTLRLTIKNSTFGPSCCGNNASGQETGSPVGIRIGTANRVSGGWPTNTDTVIDNNLIQGITTQCSEWLSGYGACPQNTCPNAQDLCHNDAIQVYGADNLAITRNRIYHNGINGIFLDSTDPEVNGTIANNMIGDVIRGATCFDIDGRGIKGTWNIINNTCSIAGGDGFYISWASTMQTNGAKWNWKGNTGAFFISNSFTPGGCQGGTTGVFTYSYNNVISDNGSATGCGGNEISGNPQFVNTALAPNASMDLHLAGGAGPADNKIPPSACATNVDIDGQTRPEEASCDVGADSRVTGGGTPPPKAACENGLDDDNDGKIDYPADPGCTSATDTDETDPVTPPKCGISTLKLTVLSQTSTTITFGWTAVPNAIGYRFYTSSAPSKYSVTWDGTRNSIKFSKGSACYYVEAIGTLANGGATG